MPPKPKNKKRRQQLVEAERTRKLFELQRDVSEAETRLKEVQRSRSKLSRDKAGLLQQLASLEHQLEATQTANSIDAVEFQRKQAQDEHAKQEVLTKLQGRLTELSQSLESYAFVQTENARLRKAVHDLQGELRRQREAHDQEEERLKKEAFDMRMQLENVSRRTLKELHQQYDARAMREMRAESDSAHQQNLILQRDLADQSSKVTRLMISQQQKHMEVRALKMERDMLLSSNGIQLSRLEDLTDAKVEHEEVLKETRSQIADLQSQNKDLEAQERAVLSVKEALEDTEEQAAEAHHDALRAQEAVAQLATRLINQAATLHPERWNNPTPYDADPWTNTPPLVSAVASQDPDAGTANSSASSWFAPASAHAHDADERRRWRGGAAAAGGGRLYDEEAEDEEECVEAIWSTRLTLNSTIRFLSDSAGAAPNRRGVATSLAAAR